MTKLFTTGHLQLWQSIQRRDMPSSESKTTGILKSSGTRGNRKVRYGWPYMERKGKPSTLVGWS